jgi:hypothetical protein
MALTKKVRGHGGARHGVRIAISKARIARDDPAGRKHAPHADKLAAQGDWLGLNLKESTWAAA